MDFDALKKLKSGTDVRGVAVGDEITLTDQAVFAISEAFCEFLIDRAKKRKLKIAVGHDPRISSERIENAVCAALLSCGVDVVKTGLCSTPSMFILLKESNFDCDGSVMITASHLPFDRNGLKFFTPDGGLSGKDIDEILKLAAEQSENEDGRAIDGNSKKIKGTVEYRPFMDEYSAILVKKVQDICGKTPLKGKKIIVDAGNGAGGFFAEKVLKPLGADTEGSLFLEPDGNFPNHIPNPEDGTAIAFLSRAVVKNKADLGIIFDTDVDRAACVDGNGREINRNDLIALIASIILPDRGGVIVTDSVTSTHLTDYIKELGGEHLRFKRGYKNVIDKCMELNSSGVYSPLAIETSGHAAFPENYYLDDGAYLVTKILCAIALTKKSPSEMIKGLKRPLEENEVRISFNQSSSDFKSEGARVIEGLREDAEKIPEIKLGQDFEGVRMELDGRWILVRMSVHDPVMPINFESDFEGGNIRSAEMLNGMLEKYPFLDLTNLKKFIFQ